MAGVPATMMRIGFVGEMGWEIVVPAEYGSYLWEQVLQAGVAVDLRPFGVETQRVLRLEKKHIIVGVDTDGLSNPYEAGMAWVAKLDKADFIGRVALARLKQSPLERMLVGFEMEGTSPPPDGSPILVAGQTGRLGHQCPLLLGEKESNWHGMGHACGSQARHAYYSPLRCGRLLRARGRPSLLRPRRRSVEDVMERRSALHGCHLEAGAQLNTFFGWQLPARYTRRIERACAGACFCRHFRRELPLQA